MFFIKFINKNKIIFAILLISFLLNSIGLYPNTLLHQDEPGLLTPSRLILKNILFSFNFDPNVEPFPFKYGSSMYYFHSIVQGLTMLILFLIDGILAIFKPQITSTNFFQYITSDVYVKHGILVLVIGRFVTVLFGTATVYLTYLVTKKLGFKNLMPLYAAFALSVTPLFVRDSHYATVDIPQTFFIMLAFYYSIDVWKNKSLKSYILAGIFVGFSISIKYFPISLLPLIYFHFLGEKKVISKKLLISFISVFFGYLIGMPYFIYHFGIIVQQYKSISEWFIPVYFETEKTFFEKFLPPYEHIYFYSFLFKEGLLPIPLIITIFGFLYGLLKKTIPVLSLTIIPFINLIFITFFLRQEYERLLIPCLPFFAIFMSIGLQKIVDIIAKNNKKKIISIVGVAVLITFFSPFIKSFSASISCTKDIPEYQVNPYIANYIPQKTIFAFHPGMRLPDTDHIWFESRYESSFSLAELQKHNVEFLATDSGYTDSFLLWSTDVLLPPRKIISNQFVQLALDEIDAKSKKMKTIKRDYMCVGNIINIYKLPETLSSAEKPLKEFSFDKNSSDWTMQINPDYSQTNIKWDSTVGNYKRGSLKYSYKNPNPNKLREDTRYSYADPSYSPFIRIAPGIKYTANAYLLEKIQSKPHTIDGFLRLDFYSKEKKLLQTSLSPRINDIIWKKLSVTAIAPSSSYSLRIGFQGTGDNKSATFWIDDVKLLTE